MDDLEIDVFDDVSLTDPVLIEGLPGVGHVGSLAANHLLEAFEDRAVLVRRIHSPALPPQVTIEDGIATLTGTDVHAIPVPDGRDMLVVTGDHQAQHAEGHYRLASAILDLAEEFGVTEGYALGGVPTGELIDEYTVLGAVTTTDVVEELEAAGVEFRENEPAGGIVGVSGLLLGLGGRRNLSMVCLMGETSGYLVDPKSARAVLEVLETLLGFDISYETLDERAAELEGVIGKIQEMESQGGMEVPSDDDLRYFG